MSILIEFVVSSSIVFYMFLLLIKREGKQESHPTFSGGIFMDFYYVYKITLKERNE